MEEEKKKGKGRNIPRICYFAIFFCSILCDAFSAPVLHLQVDPNCVLWFQKWEGLLELLFDKV
jgi:hypothetical protein